MLYISEIITFLLIAKVHGEAIFRCTGEGKGEQTIRLHCPFGQSIKIVEAIYGRNRWKQCMYTVGDCIEAVNIDKGCCGRPTCDVSFSRKYSIKCDYGYVTFFRVIYECVEADESECDIEDTDEDEDVTSLKFPPTSFSNAEPPSTNNIKPIEEPALHQDIGDSLPSKQNTVKSDEEAEYLMIILGSAVAVAFLLAAIIVVLFLLRRYKWNGEKECLLKLCVGWCKRHPPDGAENPDEVSQSSANRSHRQNMHPPHLNLNDKQIQAVRPINISKRVITKQCNIENDNQRNENKLETKSLHKTPEIDENSNQNSSKFGKAVSGNAYMQENTCIIAHEAKKKENAYVEFDKVVGEKYSNPVLRRMNPKRIVMDKGHDDATFVVSEEPGTTSV